MNSKLDAMSKEKMMVPELRFGEFAGEWEKKRLKECTSKIGSGKTPKGGEKAYVETGVPFIRSQNVSKNKLTLDNTYISEHVHSQMKGSQVNSNDVLLNITGASIGRSCVVPNNFITGNVNRRCVRCKDR